MFIAERTGFEPVEPVAQLGSLANYWFQPLTHLSGLRLSSERTERKSRSKFVNDQISGLKINENNALEQHVTASPQEIRTGKHNKERLLPDIPYANSPVNRSKNTPSTNTETVAAPPPGNIGGIARGAAQPDHTPGQGTRDIEYGNSRKRETGRNEIRATAPPSPPRTFDKGNYPKKENSRRSLKPGVHHHIRRGERAFLRTNGHIKQKSAFAPFCLNFIPVCQTRAESSSQKMNFELISL